jgi:hypothetical protein
MITPSMTGTSARDESRCGAAEEFEAAPVKAEGDNPTKNTTEILEDLFDKQLNLICDFVHRWQKLNYSKSKPKFKSNSIQKNPNSIHVNYSEKVLARSK